MDRIAIQATIKRATNTAQQQMNKLDGATIKDLEALYKQAAAEIETRIRSYAGPDNTIALQELQSVLAQVNGQLQTLSIARGQLLDNSLPDAAALGTSPLAHLDSSAAMTINTEAVKFVRSFVAKDGLQLSDRIWRLDRHARDAVTNTIEMSVIQGHGATQAAREFLMRGEQVPLEVQSKLQAANAAKIGKEAAGALLTGNGNPMDNAMRLFRTELNRAHGEAYIKGALDHPDAAGVRFKLSPAHPKPDICDLHASANLYGLGPGVYPNRGACPWPAHPNTLSYVEVVFKDEVTAADKSGKETPLQALDRLTPAQRIGAIGVNKHEAFKDGTLTQGMIKSPWKVVKKRIGMDMSLQPQKVPVPSPKEAVLSLNEMIAEGNKKTEQLLSAAKTNNSSLLELLHNDLNAQRPTTTPAVIENSGKGAELVRAASKMFPDDWTKKTDAYGPLFAKFSSSRGRQISLTKESAGGRFKIAGFGIVSAKGRDGFITAGKFSTAVHEYTHRLQHALPGIDDYFQDLHGRRTQGDPLRRLRDVFPGVNYRRDEVTREDKYLHAYQGRIYSGYGHSYLGKHGALEVMTMAFEDVLGGSATRLEAIIEKDREMFDLVIGLLFNYVP